MKILQPVLKSAVIRGIAGSMCLACLISCSSAPRAASNKNAVRRAVDVPEHFVIGEHGGPAVTEPSGSEACRSPMVDPRDGTQIQLVRSSGGVGDYEVPPGRYGVGEGEILRLDCGTGSAVGIAPRK